MVKSNDVLDGVVADTINFRVSPDLHKRFKRSTIRGGEILLTLVGANFGRSAIAPTRYVGFNCSRPVGLIPVIENPAYVMYCLRSPVVRRCMDNWANTTAQPTLNLKDVANLPIPVPSKYEQEAIAHILGTLDNRIELNRQMNATLEAMARALFQSWFVDEIVDALPTGWSEGKVGDLALFSRGTLSPAKFSDEIFAHYSLPAFDNGRVPSKDSGSEIKSNKTLVPNNSVLISKLNPRIPRIWLPSISETHRAISSTEFLIVVPKDGVTREFLFCMFGNESFMNTLAAMVTGTSGSHQRIKPDSLLSMPSVIPSKAAIQKFTEVVGPMLQKIQSNIDQSMTLAAIRDALLPKLLSGELQS